MARFATIARAAKEHGVSYYSIRNAIKQDKFPVYKLPGVDAACVDLDEVAAAFAARRPRTRDYATFGPDATVRDLTKVAAGFDVLR